MSRKQSSPLYFRVKQHILDKIRDGDLSPGDQVPSETEVMEEFKVSRTTARQALNELEREGVISRRQGKGSFVANSRNKTTSQCADIQAAPRRSVVLMVPHLRDSFSSNILLGVEEEAGRQGFGVTFLHSKGGGEEEQRKIFEALEGGACGVILFPVDDRFSAQTVVRLGAMDIPLVLVDRYIPGIVSNYVVSNNYDGGYLATRHLLDLGHRRIGFVSGERMHITSVVDRFSGYRCALGDYGLGVDERLLVRYSPKRLGLSEQEVAGPELDPIIKLLESDGRPTAIFAANDLIAIDILIAAKKAGLTVPGDLALVGFDDIDVAAHLEVPLTTVAQSPRQMGIRAMHLLVQGIRGELSGSVQEILPVKLVVRQSSGGISPVSIG